MRNATCRHSAVRTHISHHSAVQTSAATVQYGHISNHTFHELSENGTSSHPNWLTAAVWIRSAPDFFDTFTTEHSALPLGLTEQCSFAELTTETEARTSIAYRKFSIVLILLNYCMIIVLHTSGKKKLKEITNQHLNLPCNR